MYIVYQIKLQLTIIIIIIIMIIIIIIIIIYIYRYFMESYNKKTLLYITKPLPSATIRYVACFLRQMSLEQVVWCF